MKKYISILEEQKHWNGKSFDCPHDVDASDLMTILDDWERGDCKTDEVFSFAEGIAFIGGGLPDYPTSDKRSVKYIVLETLEQIYGDPILKKDIDVLKRALLKSRNQPERAHEMIHKYFDSINWEERAEYKAPNYPHD